jgi:transcriptional regulator with XRE-family HTH domain
MNQIRKVRILRELTQFDVYQRAGIHPSRLSLLERGYCRPRLDEVKRIADALKLDERETAEISAEAIEG